VQPVGTDDQVELAVGRPFEAQEQARAEVGPALGSPAPSDEFAEITSVVAAWDTLSADDRFEYGLDLLLRGLRDRYPG
jgi:Tetracyclin repressor-like, C-terminal domain